MTNALLTKFLSVSPVFVGTHHQHMSSRRDASSAWCNFFGVVHSFHDISRSFTYFSGACRIECLKCNHFVSIEKKWEFPRNSSNFSIFLYFLLFSFSSISCCSSCCLANFSGALYSASLTELVSKSLIGLIRSEMILFKCQSKIFSFQFFRIKTCCS